MFTIICKKSNNPTPHVMKVSAGCKEQAIYIVKKLGYTVITIK